MKVVISDYYYESIDQEKQIIEEAGFTLEAYRSSTQEELIQRAKDCDALIVQFSPVTRQVIEHLKNCKVIIRYAIGYDIIDVEAASEAGIVVCNVPDYCIDDVSTHAVMLLLACARGLPLYTDSVRNNRWDYAVAKPLYRISQLRVGLMGFGAIAQTVARKLSGFDVEVWACDPYANGEKAEQLGVKLVDRDTLYAGCDAISLHCPLMKQTEKMLNEEVFSKMKPGIILVNTARGGLIDEQALQKALDRGIVAAAGLDVLAQEPINPDHPLLHNPRVMVTPHVAWYSETSVRELQRKAAQEIVRVLQGKPALYMVNRPKARQEG